MIRKPRIANRKIRKMNNLIFQRRRNTLRSDMSIKVKPITNVEYEMEKGCCSRKIMICIS